MEKDYSIFFQLIRLGLGISDEAVRIPMEAWKGLYRRLKGSRCWEWFSRASTEM